MNIKACQKCGKLGRVHKMWNWYLNMEIYQVSCQHYCMNIGWYSTEENAIKAWNQYAEIKPISTAEKDSK